VCFIHEKQQIVGTVLNKNEIEPFIIWCRGIQKNSGVHFMVIKADNILDMA
jgi:hypothetical protein